MEKRRFVRQPLDLNARIALEGGPQHNCQIKDFSLGGVFVVSTSLKLDEPAKAGPSAAENQPLEIQFAVESGGAKQQYRLTGRLARVMKVGIAVEFVDPDPATLLIMQELANKAQKEYLETQEREAAQVKAAADGSSAEIPNRLEILEALENLVGRFLKDGLVKLFMEARENLFESAKKSTNTVNETECFDALRELDNIQSLVEQSFLKAVLDHVGNPGNVQLAGPESPSQKEGGGELTLVDPEKFQDWLRMKRILEKAGPKLKDKEHELHARLTAVSDAKIDEFNNPIGLVDICGSFYESVQELGASRPTRKAAFDALETSIVSKLGILWDEVNSLLVDKGILPTVEPPKHVVKKNPRTATPKSPEQPASPGAQYAPPAGGVQGQGHVNVGAAPTGAHPGQPGGAASAPPVSANPGAQSSPAPSNAASTGVHAAHSGGGASAPPPAAANAGAQPGHSSPSTSATAAGVAAAPAATGAQPAPADSAQPAQGAAAAVETAGSGASPSDTSTMHAVSGGQASPTGSPQGANFAPGRGAPASTSTYQAVNTLYGLQRQAGWAGGQFGPGASGGASGAGVPAGGKAGPSYARKEIINALSSVQHPSGGNGGAASGGNLKERIQSVLEAQQPSGAGKQLGEAEDAAIDLTTGLVESIVDDVLVSDELRSQFKRLEIPLVKAAMKNDGFFADSKHPARRVVDQLGALTIPKNEFGTKLREKVSQVVDEIASKDGDGESEFAGAADQLGALVKDQMAAYENSVRSVVEDCERQEATLQSRKKGKSAGGDEEDGATTRREVPKEFQQWLDRAARVQVGDRVAIDKGGRTHHETLAWVSSDLDKYVFVDGIGEKASSMIRQQLAMLLKRGLLRVLAETAVPAMERGMHMIMRKMHEDLVNKATQDATTGLLNRKAFLDRVNRALTDAIQTSSEHVLCYLDLDNFGQINEKWGEVAGDKLLKRFGIVLKKNMGDKGVTARLPEDEFGLVLYGCSQEKGFEFADRLRRAIASARCYWKGESLPLSVSIGVVPITDRSESIDALMAAAKATCVKAKQAGKDCVQVFEPPSEKAATQSFKHDTMVVDKILEGDRLQLQAQKVQPIGEDADGKPHYEIILGLRNIGGDLVSPEHFIRAAERSNRVTQVDRWVIQTALEWMSKNKRRLLKLGGFAINLSGRSLNDDTLTQFVMDLFMKTKVPPGKVVFEVTETAAIERLSTAEEFLRVMKDFGCRFTLEDFGTGDASYEYLRDLAVDFVKIDGMFVKELDTNSSDYAMVKSITEIGHLMGKKTIAEFVDSQATLDKLKEIGVDYAQGNLVAEPVLLQELR